ncbi:MAG: MOSC domain-containing protein YiiM [Alteromonadaceae bacterium]|jgi:MOSC domain-containing protein YiiM
MGLVLLLGRTIGMTTKHYLKGVYRGKVAQRYGMETAIDKVSVEGSVFLSIDGLEGDQCADLDHHGGAERALHQYPLEHYAYWREKYGKAIDWQSPGMGENLSSEGMTENTVCLGDRYQWGEAIIEVDQPRSPCFKLNKRWGLEHLSIDMQEISRCGWLYRVIQSGFVSVDTPLLLIERVPNAMTLHEVCSIFFGDPLDTKGLEKLKKQSRLSSSWSSKIEERLNTKQVESWHFRLLGPDSVAT